jgi:hypothetical protein
MSCQLAMSAVQARTPLKEQHVEIVLLLSNSGLAGNATRYCPPKAAVLTSKGL